MADVDFDKLKEFIFHVFGQLGGAVTSAMIHLGDRLGLYRAMYGAGPLTSSDLAERCGLHERWVREWLQSQAAAKLVDYKGDGRFEMSTEASLVLAEENSPAFAAGGFHSLPQQFAVLDNLAESFKTGIGLPYDALGHAGAVGIERFLAPWFRTFLVPLALPALDGVNAKLQAGAKVADIGCGAGLALIEMAKAYPTSHFHGYDISKHALDRARANLVTAGLRNVVFHDASADSLPDDGSFDFITSFDCLHDMTHPDLVVRAVRRALKDNGTWLIADINAKPTFEENLERNPMASMMYGISVMSCLSSSMSEAGGMGLGTLGFSEQLARDMTSAAGFTRFRRHEFENPVNAYYEVRP
ncbi:MAG TPA: methyltransferase domain-containing protein [Candidatus Acidoferrales bacterium]|nr:methyltransferase domain-containing protein [Candidatus Acidoferrales bacterium]